TTINIDDNDAAGKWTVKFILLEDNVGNNIFIHGYDMDLSAATFEVQGTESDSTPPTLNSIGIDKKTVTAGETITVTIDAIDDISGIKYDYSEITYNSPTGSATKYGFFRLENGVIKTTINIDDNDAAGKWTVKFILLEDNVSNNIFIHGYDMDLSAATFEVQGTESVSGVSLNNTSTTLVVGGTEILTATIVPADAYNKMVGWVSNNSSVADVDNNGKVIALSPGSAVITATTIDGGKTATCNVTIVPKPVSISGSQSGTGTIDVTDATPGAVLKLYNSNGTVVNSYNLESNNNHYQFISLPPGNNYTVTQTVDGYESPPSNTVTVAPASSSLTGLLINKLNENASDYFVPYADDNVLKMVIKPGKEETNLNDAFGILTIWNVLSQVENSYPLESITLNSHTYLRSDLTIDTILNNVNNIQSDIVLLANNPSITKYEDMLLGNMVGKNIDVVFCGVKTTITFALPNTDATLSSIKINNADIVNFSPLTESYNIELPVGTTSTPVISVTTTDPRANAVINQFPLPGGSTIIVTAEDGTTTETYTISFTVSNTAPTADQIQITGDCRVGEALIGNYSYSDSEGDAQGVSTFKWYRSINADGNGLEVIAGAESKTYKLVTADQDKYIYFEVTPLASVGTLQGIAVLSTASNKVEAVKVTGVAELENKNVANPTNVADLNLPTTVTINLSDGSSPSAAVNWDGGTPAYNGNAAGTYVFRGTLTLPDGVINPDNIIATINVNVASNAAPTVSDIRISGTAQVGQTLHGSYQYNDAENDPEGASTFQWYRSDNSNGTGKVAIVGATSRDYTLVEAELDEYIFFEVTPTANTGTLIGISVLSSASNKVIPAQVTIVSAQTLSDIYVVSGATLDQVGLPGTVQITLNNGLTKDISVTWNEGTPIYDGNKPGSCDFTGTLTLPNGITNPTDVKTTIKVVVATLVMNSIINPNMVNFNKNITQQFDIKITVNWNGNTLVSINDSSRNLDSDYIGGVTILKDYSISGNTITINKGYLINKSIGNSSLTFKFSGGADQSLTINVIDSTITDSTPLVAEQISVTNNSAGTSDIVKIVGLQCGDEICVYNSLTSQIPLVSKVVPEGQTEIELQVDQLGTESGTIYVSVKNSGKNESIRTPKEYSAEKPIDECFIATAAFGSKFTWPVALLRHFRDQYLLTNTWGIAFVKFYYHHSPSIAAFIAHSQSLRVLVRVLLAPIIAMVYMLYHPILMVIVLMLLTVLSAYRFRLRRRYV
ncbi:MAG: CFI-box-CTERM domain-containing protein, partial [Syntrophomonas sp.]